MQDGRGAAVDLNGGPTRLYRTDSGWRPLGPVYSDVDFGPDSRVVGQAPPPPGWTGFTPVW